MRFAGWILGMAALALTANPTVAGSSCPPPPNPNDFGCPLEPNRAVLQEADADGDGQPDNQGATGSFCGGNSAADCVGFQAAEVGLALVINDPAVQTVTCTAPGVDVWIMSSTCSGCLATGFGSATLPAGTTTETTLRVVVADVNGDVCPCGPILTCTFDRETACGDGADGDGDGLIDGADPDCCVDNDFDGVCEPEDCAPSSFLVHAAPQADAVELLLDTVDGMARAQWVPQPGSVADLATGRLSDLRGQGTFAQASCLADDEAGNGHFDPRLDPPAGDGDYYLLRLQNECGTSGYGPGPGFGTDRDDLDDASPCSTDLQCDGCSFTECDLLDPGPVCGGRHCQPLADFSGTTCLTEAGSGTQTDSCEAGLADCAAGYSCIEWLGIPICAAWCRVAGTDCGFGTACVGYSPPVVLGATEYGACVPF